MRGELFFVVVVGTLSAASIKILFISTLVNAFAFPPPTAFLRKYFKPTSLQLIQVYPTDSKICCSRRSLDGEIRRRKIAVIKTGETVRKVGRPRREDKGEESGNQEEVIEDATDQFKESLALLGEDALEVPDVVKMANKPKRIRKRKAKSNAKKAEIPDEYGDDEEPVDNDEDINDSNDPLVISQRNVNAGMFSQANVEKVRKDIQKRTYSGGRPRKAVPLQKMTNAQIMRMKLEMPVPYQAKVVAYVFVKNLDFDQIGNRTMPDRGVKMIDDVIRYYEHFYAKKGLVSGIGKLVKQNTKKTDHEGGVLNDKKAREIAAMESNPSVFEGIDIYGDIAWSRALLKSGPGSVTAEDIDTKKIANRDPEGKIDDNGMAVDVFNRSSPTDILSYVPPLQFDFVDKGENDSIPEKDMRAAQNSTALYITKKVIEYLKACTFDDPRISYDINVVYEEDAEEDFDVIDETMQIWVESYNSYHLLDGLSFKDFYKEVKPHQVLRSTNLQFILKQLNFALWEQRQRHGVILDQDMRSERLQGGAEYFDEGFNTGESERTSPFPMRAVDR